MYFLNNFWCGVRYVTHNSTAKLYLLWEVVGHIVHQGGLEDVFEWLLLGSCCVIVLCVEKVLEFNRNQDAEER